MRIVAQSARGRENPASGAPMMAGCSGHFLAFEQSRNISLSQVSPSVIIERRGLAANYLSGTSWRGDLTGCGVREKPKATPGQNVR